MKAVGTLEAIVHDLDQATAALDAAAAAGVPARLFSPPGAALALGPGYWRALADALAASHSGARVEVVLDCADDPGAVLAALGEGIAAVRFVGSAEVRGRLDEVARRSGARLFGDRLPALDLGRTADPGAACRAALHCPEP